MMDCHDMDLSVNEPIDDSVGALDQFSNGGIIDFWYNTSGLRKCGQPFDRSDQLLPDKLSIVKRILRDELLYRLDIFYCPARPDQRGHLRS